jgi:ribosomal protein S18 acetylase RimI-like enzyme
MNVTTSADLQVVEVRSNRDLRSFVRLPKRLYADDAMWIPPLWHDEMRAYDRKHNPILRNADYTLHLAMRGGQVVGRNLVYVDNAFNGFNDSKIGFFGAFECENDPKVASRLMQSAEKWLGARGMESIRGPIHPTAEIWGFLHDGFSRPPIMMSPYNPPSYNDHLAANDYYRIKDLLVYEADATRDYVLPDRFMRFSENLLRRHPYIQVRRLNLGDFRTEATNVWRISNASYVGNWGYVPVDEYIVEDLIRRLRPILDSDAVWFVEDLRRPPREQAVGYALGFPDINPTVQQIDGKLFPLGLIRLLRAVKRERNYRLFALGVLPEYHGLGLDVLMYVMLYKALAPRHVRLEANYILEDNYRIRNALEKLGLEHIKTYRIYEKQLSS